jgi:hypothetical protein
MFKAVNTGDLAKVKAFIKPNKNILVKRMET